jgi:hypothetical protein
MLSDSKRTAVEKAYSRRCTSDPSMAEFEARRGVKKVDYLLDKVLFRGLVWVDDFKTMKLIVG